MGKAQAEPPAPVLRSAAAHDRFDLERLELPIATTARDVEGQGDAGHQGVSPLAQTSDAIEADVGHLEPGAVLLRGRPDTHGKWITWVDSTRDCLVGLEGWRHTRRLLISDTALVRTGRLARRLPAEIVPTMVVSDDRTTTGNVSAHRALVHRPTSRWPALGSADARSPPEVGSRRPGGQLSLSRPEVPRPVVSGEKIER